MHYQTLVERVAELSGCPEEVVREILFALPSVLAEMALGDMVKTPLGVFRVIRTKARIITPPYGGSPVPTPSSLVVKLRPGIRLRSGV